MSIIKKFTSRKFWAGMAGVIAPMLVLLKMPDNDIATVTALIGACGTLIAYIFAESSVDIARAESTNENDSQ